MHGLILDLTVVTAFAAATGLIMRRLGQPSILGYLLAGLIVGPYIPIPVFADPARMAELAEVGVVLVMFAIGLEFRVRRLLDVLPTSGLTAAVQIGALFWAGYTVGSVAGWTAAGSISLGATLAISSTMVVSAVLRARPVDPDVRSHVFGVLVVQDVVAIVLIAVITALASGETVGLRSLGLMIAELIGVVAGMLAVALLLLPRLVRYAADQDSPEVLVVLVVGAAFGLAFAAHAFGYSVALGAFIAGMAVAESGRAHEVEESIEPLRALFSGIFFVSIGMTVDPRIAWETLPLALGLCGIVIVVQFLSVTLGTVLTGSALRRAVFSGLALGQIGELSFILATIAIAGNLVPPETMPALVTVATITAFTTPLFLGRGQALLELLDRRLPAGIHQALAAYQTFLRARSGEATWRRPAIAVFLDWGGLIVLFVARETIEPLIDPEYVLALNAGAIALATPLLVGLVRSGIRLVAAGRARARGSAGPTPRSRVVEAFGLLAVVLAIGLPTLAIISPLIEGPWVGVVVSAVLLVALVTLGLRLGRLGGDFKSGVARIASELAERAGVDDGELHVEAEGPLAGLDYRPIAVTAGSPADGLSLAELDLRCCTGATVLAIQRGADTVLLPTGHEALRAGDVLAISGSEESLERARTVLLGRS